MVAYPGFPVDRPCDRQAPRAPLPHFGVTLMGKTSCAFSKGITLSSSLIRTHAPSLYPPSDFRFSPYTKGLCRLLPAPCCVKALPNAISVVLPCVPGPLLQLLPRCSAPVSSPGTLAFPVCSPGRRLASLHRCYFGWSRFWSCSHSFTFRPTGLFASQVAPTLTLACRAAEAFTAAHITVGCLPRAAAMLTIQTGQLMVRGLAPLRSDRLVGYSVYHAAR
jgi:hypothetical protein